MTTIYRSHGTEKAAGNITRATLPVGIPRHYGSHDNWITELMLFKKKTELFFALDTKDWQKRPAEEL